MAPLFTARWLSDVLPKALGLSRPALHNSDGDEVVFYEVRFPLAPQTTPSELGERFSGRLPFRSCISQRRPNKPERCRFSMMARRRYAAT
jgi:hypothetical protein